MRLKQLMRCSMGARFRNKSREGDRTRGKSMACFRGAVLTIPATRSTVDSRGQSWMLIPGRRRPISLMGAAGM